MRERSQQGTEAPLTQLVIVEGEVRHVIDLTLPSAAVLPVSSPLPVLSTSTPPLVSQPKKVELKKEAAPNTFLERVFDQISDEDAKLSFDKKESAEKLKKMMNQEVIATGRASNPTATDRLDMIIKAISQGAAKVMRRSGASNVYYSQISYCLKELHHLKLTDQDKSNLAEYLLRLAYQNSSTFSLGSVSTQNHNSNWLNNSDISQKILLHSKNLKSEWGRVARVLLAIAGALLIGTALALSVFTFGATTPPLFLIFGVVLGKVVSGLSAVTGAAFLSCGIYGSESIRQRANNIARIPGLIQPPSPLFSG